MSAESQPGQHDNEGLSAREKARIFNEEVWGLGAGKSHVSAHIPKDEGSLRVGRRGKVRDSRKILTRLRNLARRGLLRVNDFTGQNPTGRS